MCHHFLLDKGPVQVASVGVLQQHPGLAHVLAPPIYLRPLCSLQGHALHRRATGAIPTKQATRPHTQAAIETARAADLAAVMAFFKQPQRTCNGRAYEAG